jgi:hypothetical protein
MSFLVEENEPGPMWNLIFRGGSNVKVKVKDPRFSIPCSKE